MWQNLKTKIKAFLTANTLIQEVYGYEVEQFGGDPAATIVASKNEADYRTTTQNRRVYAFEVRLWVKRGAPRTDAQAEDVLTDIIDTVLDKFDKYYTLGVGSPGSALVLPAGYTMIRTEAMPAEWGYAEREMLYRFATVTVRCILDVDVTLIS